MYSINRIVTLKPLKVSVLKNFKPLVLDLKYGQSMFALVKFLNMLKIHLFDEQPKKSTTLFNVKINTKRKYA